MRQLRFLALLIGMMACACTASAQYAASPTGLAGGDSQAKMKAELEAIGRGLDNDSVGFYERYVYDDAQTVGRQVALSLPVLPDQDVQDWLKDNVAQILTVSPTQYPLHAQEIGRYFTRLGLEQLKKQWDDSSIPALIVQNNYHMAGLVVQTPQVLAKGRQNGVYRWITNVPVLLTYTPPAPAAPQAFNLVLRVGLTRIPMQDDGRLIAIDTWTLAPAPLKAPAAAPAY